MENLNRSVQVGNVRIGGGAPLALIAGPCVIESEESSLTAASSLKEICGRIGIPFIFKSSFDKANRTSVNSFRGPGMEEGIDILRTVQREMDVPVTTDVHDINQVQILSEVLDLFQIPAFLCRQTNL